jgi:tRNA pseudouridine32 synthase/23S rRNA pseudouridine746 synthase
MSSTATIDPLAGIPVVYQDAALLVINKPAGLASLPEGYDPTLPHLKSLLEPKYGPLWVVHRLDKDTSGVLVLARTAAAHRSLNTQFERHTVVKVYHALVIGDPDWREKTVNLALRPNGDRQHRTVIDPQHGKPAITHLKVLERLGGYSVLEAIPETGRTHQIRAHLSTLKLAIVGDNLYRLSPAGENAPIPAPTTFKLEYSIHFEQGMGLHARLLAINHPVSGAKLTFIAPYPAAWEAALQQLRSLTSGDTAHKRSVR